MKSRIGVGLAVVTCLAWEFAVAADITGTVTLKGTPPPEVKITDLMENPDCGPLHKTVPTTHFYVVGPQGQLADVVVFIKNLSGQSTGASAPPLVIDQKGCEFIPYVSAVQTGQKVIVRNSDPVEHNVHDTPTAKGNREMNRAMLPGSPDLTFVFNAPEPFLRFKCDVHNWMFAYVSVFDHPYFAVTGPDGRFTIAHVPPGKYVLEAHHRKVGVLTQEVEVTDNQNATADFQFVLK